MAYFGKGKSYNEIRCQPMMSLPMNLQISHVISTNLSWETLGMVNLVVRVLACGLRGPFLLFSIVFLTMGIR